MNFSKNDINSKDVHPNVQNLIRNEQLTPPAEEINLESGKGKWTIKGIPVWADSYEEAVEIYCLI